MDAAIFCDFVRAIDIKTDVRSSFDSDYLDLALSSAGNLVKHIVLEVYAAQ